MKPPFHDPLTDFSPELDEKLYEAGVRQQALEFLKLSEPMRIEMRGKMTNLPVGKTSSTALKAMASAYLAQECTLSSECECRACTKVFGASKAHVGNHHE